uniref:Uncharacterized protein n=1 Tax=Latimeria chalumnae TaxID=7897 RepID=H3B1L6_LATCH
FWDLVLNIELLIFTLVHSFRKANFTFDLEPLSELIPYFFANDHVHYARLLPIHLRDMMSIEGKHPEVAREFLKGNFVVHKSNREFSVLVIDQTHEQNNAVVKGNRGASALTRWMVAGPDIGNPFQEFQSFMEELQRTDEYLFYESIKKNKIAFFKQVPAAGKSQMKTFDDYAREDVLPKTEAYCSKYKRTDIVYDVYRQASLKSEARSKRGKGIWRRVTRSSKTLPNWQSFLRVDDNKTELFESLADKIALLTTTNRVIVTKGENIVKNIIISQQDIAPCSHEEADTHIFLHARHATMEGNKINMINANDTDVIVVAISVLSTLKELGLEKLWIPIHEIVSAIGPAKVSGIPCFHAFSGCDIVSVFHGKGKKSAW